MIAKKNINRLKTNLTQSAKKIWTLNECNAIKYAPNPNIQIKS